MEHGANGPVKDQALLTDPREFEEYLSRISGLLQSRWSDRVSFLEGALERLHTLANDAALVRDEALVEQLRGHEAHATETLATLRNTSPFAIAAAPTEAPQPRREPSAPVLPPPSPISEDLLPPVSSPQPEPVVPTSPFVPDPAEGEAMASPAAPAPASPAGQDWHSVLQQFWTAPAAPAEPATPDPSSNGGPAPTPQPEVAAPPASFFGVDPSPVQPPSVSVPPLAASVPPLAASVPSPLEAPSAPTVVSPPTLGWDLDIRVDPAPLGEVTPPPASENGESGPPVLRLAVSSGERQTEWAMEGEVAVIGRRDSGGQNRPELDLFPDQAVSRRHAQISRRRDGFYFVDLGSANGTQVNGEILAPLVEHRLAEGDEILIGELTTLVVLPAAPTR